jgi:hypothetical protein
MGLFATAFVRLTCCIPGAWAQNGVSPGGAGRGPVHSPEVSRDHTVTFRLRAPAASEVSLSGEFIMAPMRTKRLGHVWAM